MNWMRLPSWILGKGNVAERWRDSPPDGGEQDDERRKPKSRDRKAKNRERAKEVIDASIGSRRGNRSNDEADADCKHRPRPPSSKVIGIALAIWRLAG